MNLVKCGDQYFNLDKVSYVGPKVQTSRAVAGGYERLVVFRDASELNFINGLDVEQLVAAIEAEIAKKSP